MDLNTRFCKLLLQQALLGLTGHEKAHFQKCAGCLKTAFGSYLVEWPDMGEAGRTFALEVEADNVNEAKAKAINNWLVAQAAAVRQRHSKTGFPET